MNIENVSALIEHAKNAPADEANMALDLARSSIRRGKLDALANLVEAAGEEQRTLENIRALLAAAVGQGRANATARRLHALLATKPTFDPHGGIRAATKCFEWAQKHQSEVSNLLAKI